MPSSTASPILKRRPLSASRLIPDTTRLRRSTAGSGRGAAQQGADHGQVLGLDQGDLTRAAPARAIMIALQSLASDSGNRLWRLHGGTPLGTETDPLQAPGAREAGQQRMNIWHRIQRSRREG